MPDSNRPGAFRPTITHSSEERPAESSLDVSRAKVGLVEGTRPRFTDETATLLRDRLKAATLVLSIILALAFVGNLFAQYAPRVVVRVFILFTLIGAFVLLRSQRRRPLGRLHISCRCRAHLSSHANSTELASAIAKCSCDVQHRKRIQQFYGW
jgi:hypothetical protein